MALILKHIYQYGCRFVSACKSHRHSIIKVVKFVRLSSCYEDPGDEDSCSSKRIVCSKCTKNFITPYSIPFPSVLHQNKVLHNFHKWGNHLTAGCIKGLD